MSAIEVRGLRKSYGSLEAVRGVDFAIELAGGHAGAHDIEAVERRLGRDRPGLHPRPAAPPRPGPVIPRGPRRIEPLARGRPPARHRVFTHLSPMTDALAILYNLWNQKTPTLFDPMAVAMVIDPALCQTKPLDVQVDTNGFTHVGKDQPPNATVALKTDPRKFFEFYLSRVAPRPKQ